MMDTVTISLGNLGSVTLVDVMPRENADRAVVDAARRSVGNTPSNPTGDRALIRRLMRSGHTSPFEMVEFKFLIKCPIFIARQWLRHRTANVNELSGRYSEMPEEFYIPDATDIRTQSDVNKQSSEGSVNPGVAAVFVSNLTASCQRSFDDYKSSIPAGVCREQARFGLPLNTMTEFYWKIDLHNLLNFIRLRSDPGAQAEIQRFSNALYRLAAVHAPLCFEAFEDYVLANVALSRMEQAIITSLIRKDKESANIELAKFGKSERVLFDVKLQKLGLLESCQALLS